MGRDFQVMEDLGQVGWEKVGRCSGLRSAGLPGHCWQEQGERAREGKISHAKAEVGIAFIPRLSSLCISFDFCWVPACWGLRLSLLLTSLELCKANLTWSNSITDRL